MFSLANYFAKQKIKVSWMNSPSFGFMKYCEFVPKKVKKSLRPFFLVREDEVIKDSFVSVYDSWAPPKYDTFDFSFYVNRYLQKIYSNLLSLHNRFDVFLFDSPIFADMAAKLKKSQGTRIMYHSPDDYFAYSGVSNNFKQSEKATVKVADLIIVPTQSIRKNILNRNKSNLDVRLIPNGVSKAEITRFPTKRETQTTPRIGFIGVLASWVNVNLVFAVATRMPECKFIIAGDGPYYNYWKQKSPPNCKLIGRVSIAQRKKLISSFDAGLIPFELNAFTNSAFPLKLLEYFARGVPVISSPLVEMKNIASDFIYFADDPETWVNQINNALNEPYDTKLSYINFASRYTWEKAADLLLDVISE